MVDHPLIPDDVRIYMQKHQIERFLNQGLNEVLKSFPQDPLSVIAATLIDNTTNIPIFERFHARETIIGENTKSIKLTVYLNYQGKVLPYYTHIYTFNLEDTSNFLWDKQDEKSGMKNACEIINTQINSVLQGKDLLNFKKIDETLQNFIMKFDWSAYNGNPENCDNVIISVQEALYLAYGVCVNQANPYQAVHQNLKGRPLTSKDKIPKLMFNVLNGGKALTSKVKFSRFYLILDISPTDQVDAMEIFLKIQAQIRKQISSHKLGENGFKPGQDGSYFNAYENVNESFKILEDCINAVGVNGEKKYLKIGINPDIDNSYLRDQGKYDIEGPKNLFDSDQLTDYFIKMCNDHPLVEYLEDPIAEGDYLGYQKLLKKFKEVIPRVKIGVKSWFKSHIDAIKDNTQMITLDDDELEEREKKKKEEQERLEKLEQERKDEVKTPADGKGKAPPPGKKPDPKQQDNKKSQSKLETMPNAQSQLSLDDKDPNRMKFIPNVVHLERNMLKINQKLHELVIYQQGLKAEEQFQYIIEDCYQDSIQGEVVDLSFGIGCSYLNLRGFFRPEKTAKVQRFNEILEQMRRENEEQE